ncbi:hypothetical protein GGS21DRAFT_7719 [Xylaria nigripes]|nr:hypothetical protein GGS21DRAFT_7719 [Xylaria nigripes]
MTADMSFSTGASLDCPVDDTSTGSDDYSSISSDDLHIGTPSRPQLPPLVSTSSLSTGLPLRFAGAVAARRRPTSHYQHVTKNSSLSPNLSQHRTSAPPNRLTSAVPPQASERPERWRSDPAESQYEFDDRSHGQDCDSVLSSVLGSLQERDEAEVDKVNHGTSQARGRSLSFNFNKAQSQRAHIRELWQRKNEADRKFMAAAQMLIADSTQLHQLRQLFDNMQDTHLRYEAAEKLLEEITDELLYSMTDSALEEESFHTTSTGTSKTGLFRDVNQDTRPDNSDNITLCGITGDRHQSAHPLYEKLCKAFGELQLAKELLVNTKMKREAFQAQKSQLLAEDSLDLLETYGDAGRRKARELRAMARMTEDDHEQLQEYDELEKSAKQDIEFYTERVSNLQYKCKENGVLPPFSYFHQNVIGNISIARDEISLTPDINEKPATLAHPVFTLLLSNPTHLLNDFPQTALESLRLAIQLPRDAPVRAKMISEAAREANMNGLLSAAESDNKHEFINRWLLHKLYNSVMEAELLWSTFQAKLGILDIDRWQRDVLYFWWRDDPIDDLPVSVRSDDTDRNVELSDRAAESNESSYYETEP